jgi:hypothetical protein
VSLALVLAVDVSTRVNDQRFGCNAAATPRRSPNQSSAARDTARQIAVTSLQWAAVDASMSLSRGRSYRTPRRTAGRRAAAARPRSRGWTSIRRAIHFSVRLLDTSPYPNRRVIDVSGDGVSNSGRRRRTPREARWRAASSTACRFCPSAAAGWHHALQVPLDEFYRDNVIGGQGAFVVIAGT